MFLPDSSFYVGTFKNGHSYGEGRYIYSNGSYYEGDIENDLAEGEGIFYNEIIGYKYTGEWERDVPNGRGVEEWKSGARY